MPKSSLPLGNLRGVLILLILAFHSFAAYIVSQPASTAAFDKAPYDWIAFPIIDSQRWIGFDLFCAFQFLYLMQLMFFLSGLFVWPSLRRRGWKTYLGHRLWRLGAPFIVGTYALMPLAFYPVYRVTALDPGWSSFWSHWMALPITPTGPMWFLWFLILLDLGAALLYRASPDASRLPAQYLAKAATHPGRLFIALVCVCAVAYLPLSAIYSPWKWVGWGPFEVQAAFAPQYAIYFVLGLAVGSYGYDRGLLDKDGTLVRRWPIWLVGSLASFFLWVIPTALIVKEADAPVGALRVIGDLALVIFAGAACLSLTALFLRFATTRWPIIDSISEYAYGIYFFHYAFVLWLQYLLLGSSLPAVGKGLIAFAASFILSWTTAVVVYRLLGGIHLLLGRRVALPGPTSTVNGEFSETKP